MDKVKLSGVRKIGVVTSKFNDDVTHRLREGALVALEQNGIAAESILCVEVPGAFEIPLATKVLFENGCHGVVALGAVIRGETTHYDYVCAAVERGCSQLQLEYMRPVGFGVLTTENEDQALQRAGGIHGNKGAETAEVVLKMLSLLEQFNSI